MTFVQIERKNRSTDVISSINPYLLDQKVFSMLFLVNKKGASPK